MASVSIKEKNLWFISRHCVLEETEIKIKGWCQKQKEKNKNELKIVKNIYI